MHQLADDGIGLQVDISILVVAFISHGAIEAFERSNKITTVQLTTKTKNPSVHSYFRQVDFWRKRFALNLAVSL